MKLRRRKRYEEGINLTPLIDVVFLLLIFFMVSTTFTRETRLSIELPEALGPAQQEQQPARLEVLVDEDGSYAVNGQLLVNRKIDTIMAALTEQSQGDNSTTIIITADAEAPHRAVVAVMDAAGRLGFSNLSIATQEPADR